MFRILFILINLSLLSACAVKVQDKTIYTLSDTLYQNHQDNYKRETIVISMPTANVGYETKNMLYTKKPYEIKAFSKHQWAGPPAKMLHPLLIQHLSKTGYFQATATPPLTAFTHKVLKAHLLEFRQDFTSNPSCIRITIRADIVDKGKDKIIASELFTIDMPTTSNTPYAGVIASNKATRILLDQIARYCVEHLITHPILLPPPNRAVHLELKGEI